MTEGRGERETKNSTLQRGGIKNAPNIVTFQRGLNSAHFNITGCLASRRCFVNNYYEIRGLCSDE
jgi:hypothetical protein